MINYVQYLDLVAAFAGGVAFMAVPAFVLIREINRQWRRDLNQAAINMQRYREAFAHGMAFDEGQLKGEGPEAVRMGVGDFYHLKGADLVDTIAQPDMFGNANPGNKED